MSNPNYQLPEVYDYRKDKKRQHKAFVGPMVKAYAKNADLVLRMYSSPEEHDYLQAKHPVAAAFLSVMTGLLIIVVGIICVAINNIY